MLNNYMMNLHESANWLLDEVSNELLKIRPGKLFKSMMEQGLLTNGWYLINTKTGEIVSSGITAADMFDKGAEQTDKSILEVVRVSNNKIMKSKDCSDMRFSENFPAGYYIVDETLNKIISGPMNISMARNHAKGKNKVQQATGVIKFA